MHIGVLYCQKNMGSNLFIKAKEKQKAGYTLSDVKKFAGFKQIEDLGIKISDVKIDGNNMIMLSFDPAHIEVPAGKNMHNYSITFNKDGKCYKVTQRRSNPVRTNKLRVRDTDLMTVNDWNLRFKHIITEFIKEIRYLENAGYKIYKSPEERHLKRGLIVGRKFGF